MIEDADRYVARELARIDAERARFERQMRGEPLTPEEEERIRARERRYAMEDRIRRDERAKAQGFPYYPMWLLPAFFAAVSFLAGGLGAWLALRGR